MSSSVDTPILKTLDKLRRSPLCNLSLASKELFHSNFLAWLCETYPAHAGKLFALFIKNPPDNFDTVCASRELHRVDLTLTYENGEQLLVENKVKSLPSREQLAAISAGVKKKEIPNSSFLLLTLVDPTFFSADEREQRCLRVQAKGREVIWHYITYRKLADALEKFVPEIRKRDGYHGDLLEDYLGFVRDLDELQSDFSVEWESDASSFFIPNAEMDQVRITRLHDLVDKIRYDQLAWRAQELLQREGFCVMYGGELTPRHVKKLLESNRGVKVFVGSAMTRGTGICDVKYVLAVNHGTPLMLGVQLQANNLKLFLEVDDKRKAKNLADALWQPRRGERIWYRFSGVSASSHEFPKNGTFNKYGKTFFYRSTRLGPTSPKNLGELLVRYIRSIRDNEAALLRQMEDVL
jgi:hypothetical protein